MTENNSYVLCGARIYDTDSESYVTGGIAVKNGVITELGTLSEESSAAAEDVGGARIIPAMVDVHTHGRCGCDFCGASREELTRLRRAYAESGTATVIPTLASGTLEQWLESTDNIHALGFDGIHYEGRYLSPEKRGAHAPELLKNPDAEELRLLMRHTGDMRVHVSMAAELPGGDGAMAAVIDGGGTVGLAHTSATYEQAMHAVECGLHSFTHVFNAMTGMSHRAPGVVGAALSSGLYTEFICDGVHIHPSVIKIAYNAVPHDRFVLITDSLMAAGLGDGEYELAGQPVRVENGIARTGDGAIAGSMLDLFTAVKNLSAFAGIPFEQALPAATSVPARMWRLDGVTGSLRVGLRADMLLLDERGGIDRVYAAGELI